MGGTGRLLFLWAGGLAGIIALARATGEQADEDKMPPAKASEAKGARPRPGLGFVAPDGDIPCFGIAEFTVRTKLPSFLHPFTQVRVSGVFRPERGDAVEVDGFCDADDGSVHRIRFSPEVPAASYRYVISYTDPMERRTFEGAVRSGAAGGPGPVIVDPANPRGFVRKGSGEPFVPIGATAYHLFDPTNDDARIRSTLEHYAGHGINRVRFLVAGYPKGGDNYGAPEGEVNPLPIWKGEPHAYDFSRFNLEQFRRMERALAWMRDRGIAASVIFTIEKQGLPQEYGALSADEYRFYRYTVARLAAFANVWWDLGNEHNEYRGREWGHRMGTFVKACDPYGRPVSAHGYEDFRYAGDEWADFIITQQHGEPAQVHEWALRYSRYPKPYINEEYGYEGERDEPGHHQNAERVRRCHWAVAMAGGHATYGDGVRAAFYTGDVGGGKALAYLEILSRALAGLPFHRMVPVDRVDRGFALLAPGEALLVYLPEGGSARVDLSGLPPTVVVRWLDPRTGNWSGPEACGKLDGDSVEIHSPGPGDWASLIRTEG